MQLSSLSSKMAWSIGGSLSILKVRTELFAALKTTRDGDEQQNSGKRQSEKLVFYEFAWLLLLEFSSCHGWFISLVSLKFIEVRKVASDLRKNHSSLLVFLLVKT